MISVTRSIPASELIVVGWDLNGHVGKNVGQSQMGLLLICIWILVMAYCWKR